MLRPYEENPRTHPNKPRVGHPQVYLLSGVTSGTQEPAGCRRYKTKKETQEGGSQTRRGHDVSSPYKGKGNNLAGSGFFV